MKTFFVIASLLLFSVVSMPALAQNAKNFDKLPEALRRQILDTQTELAAQNTAQAVTLETAAAQVLKEKEKALTKIETEELLIANGMIAHLESLAYSNQNMQLISDIKTKKERIEEKIKAVKKEIKSLEKFLKTNEPQEDAVQKKTEEEKQAFEEQTILKIKELAAIELS